MQELGVDQQVGAADLAPELLDLGDQPPVARQQAAADPRPRTEPVPGDQGLADEQFARRLGILVSEIHAALRVHGEAIQHAALEGDHLPGILRPAAGSLQERAIR
jgi:hypothetical protein